MSDNDLFEMIEIDIPKCSRTFGVAPCTAALGGVVAQKCWNLRGNCADVPNYLAGSTLTLRFCRDAPIPIGISAFPALITAREQSTSVNIAGQHQNLTPIGRRATLSISLSDFTHDDVGVDPYQSERISGAAQSSGIGYDVEANGTFLKRLKARWPHYAGKPLRLVRGYIDSAGALTDITTTHWVISEIDGPSNGELSIKALDILDLANEKTALCPKPSPGILSANITEVDGSFIVTPSGAGASYPASGRLSIGSEIMGFTRSGDTFTVSRGQRGTSAATHSAGDTVQLAYSVTGGRLNNVAADLILNYTQIPPIYLDAAQQAVWNAEVARWGAGLVLETDITAPTSVATLIGELGALGCTIWPDQVAQKMLLRMNRPLDGEVPRPVSDNTAISVETEDREEDRLTQVLFYGGRFNPTKSLTDAANYSIGMLTVDTEAFAAHGSVRSRTIFTRWLDNADATTMSIVSNRLLRRFRVAPKTITIRLDAAEKAVALMDVVDLTSDEMAGPDGKPVTRKVQVYQRSEPTPYVDVELLCQLFDFEGRHGFIMPDGSPVYGSASQAEKDGGSFIAADAVPYFPDFSDAYRII